MADLIKLFARAGQKFRYGPAPGGGGGGAHEGAGGDVSINLADVASWPAGLTGYRVTSGRTVDPITGALNAVGNHVPRVGRRTATGLPGLFLAPARLWCTGGSPGWLQSLSFPSYTADTTYGAAGTQYIVKAPAADVDLTGWYSLHAPSLEPQLGFPRYLATTLWIKGTPALGRVYVQIRSAPGSWGPLTAIETAGVTRVDCYTQTDVSVAWQIRFFSDAAGSTPLTLTGKTPGEPLFTLVAGGLSIMLDLSPHTPVVGLSFLGNGSSPTEELAFPDPRTIMPGYDPATSLIEVVTSDYQYYEVPGSYFPSLRGDDPAFGGPAGAGAHLISLNFYLTRPEN